MTAESPVFSTDRFPFPYWALNVMLAIGMAAQSVPVEWLPIVRNRDITPFSYVVAALNVVVIIMLLIYTNPKRRMCGWVYGGAMLICMSSVVDYLIVIRNWPLSIVLSLTAVAMAFGASVAWYRIHERTGHWWGCGHGAVA